MLIDGSLQFGDLRALLKVPVDAPSILDLPDRPDRRVRPPGRPVARSVGDRHPPRPAAGRDGRDGHHPRHRQGALAAAPRLRGDRHRHARRRSTTSTSRSSTRRDTIVEIVTYDSTTIHNTIAVADAFRMIGYPASKVHYLVNRADSPGGIEPDDLARALGRVPGASRRVGRHARRPDRTTTGVPFVLANPGGRDQPGPHARVAAELMAVARVAASGPRRVGPAGRCPTRDRSASSTRGSAA